MKPFCHDNRLHSRLWLRLFRLDVSEPRVLHADCRDGCLEDRTSLGLVLPRHHAVRRPAAEIEDDVSGPRSQVLHSSEINRRRWRPR